MSNWMQSSNYTADLKAAGMTTPQETLYLAEASLSNAGRSGKIRSGSSTHALLGLRQTLPGIYYNLNAGDPTKWLYSPDLSR